MKRVIFLLLLAWIALASCGGSSQPSQTNAPATATESARQTNVATDLTQIAATQTAESQPVVTPTPTPFPTPQTGIGGTQQSGPWSITINSIKPTVSDNQFEVPKAGNQFILVNFTAQNTSGGAEDMNPYYFTLRDSQGTTYDLTALTVARSPEGTVLPGQKLRGDLSYELPKSLHDVTLQFDTPGDIDNSQVVQWQLTL